jgi:hypothetical protein
LVAQFRYHQPAIMQNTNKHTLFMSLLLVRVENEQSRLKRTLSTYS